ncbi:complement factor B, isoform CRA_f [Mus musculus]|nr:complement factor B, isoform CRA_f [Mus musculus]
MESPQLCLVLLVLGFSSGGVSATPVLEARPQVSCSLEGVEIKGGSFQLLQGGQALEYLCPSGFYPYPVQTRTCRSTGSWSIEEVLFHPKYNINGKKAEGIPEFYDYDVALVKLKNKLKYGQTLRPICLPCTEGTTRALRLPQTATCKQHKEQLLPVKDVKALFVSEQGKSLTRKEVYIKNGDKKASCERDATKAQGYEKVKDASEVVTPRFLCTGGVDPYADPNTCKGDSGGPLIVHKRSRFIQVGVISWGVVDVCRDQRRQQLVPSYARDFHINLFQVLPWLKDKLKDEDLGFL